MSAVDWPTMEGERMVPLFAFFERSGAPTLATVARRLYDADGFLWARIAALSVTFGAVGARDFRSYQRAASEGRTFALLGPAPLPDWGAIAATQPDVIQCGAATIFDALEDCALAVVDADDPDDPPLAGIFVQAFAAGACEDGARVPGAWGMADPAGSGYGVARIAVADMYLRERDARRLVTAWGASAEALEALTPATLRRLPSWASWEALADALDPAHPQHAPDLAAAFRLWSEHVRKAEKGKKTPTHAQLMKRLPKGTPRPAPVASVAVPQWRKR